MLRHPRVVGGDVVGHEVEHQLQAVPTRTLAHARQRRIAAERLVHRVDADRESRARDVVVAQGGQRRLELAAPGGIRSRHLLRRGSGLPDAEQPDPVDALRGPARDLGVAQVVERRAPADRAADLGQPHARVQLEEGGIPRRRHRRDRCEVDGIVLPPASPPNMPPWTAPGRRPARLSERAFEQAARDHLHRERLFRALEDRQHPRIDEPATHGSLLGVAHAAVDLLRLARHALGRAAREELDQARLHPALAAVDLLADRVREGAARGKARSHLRDLDLRERVVDEPRAEHAAVPRVRDRRLQRRAHHAERPARGLDPAADHPRHRQVEAPAQAAFAADDVGVGDEEVLEREVERVHAAVAYRRDRTAVQLAAAVLPAEFQKILDHRSVDPTNPYVTLAKLGLGRARALAGDTAAARLAYDDFLAAWKDADPDLPLLKQARSEYAKLR